MSLVSSGQNYIDWQIDNELVRIVAWGVNSIRVFCVPNGEINLIDQITSALIPKHTAAKIEISKNSAVIKNGIVSAKINLKQNVTGRLHFYKRDVEILSEIDSSGSQYRQSRLFKPIIGGDWELTASFESDPDEMLFGMGQYQQSNFNLKGCNFELAQRNSQVSIPFVISNKGYGFFWNNPAIGTASFGVNRTEWCADSTKKLDYWITAGDTPRQIIEQFTDVVGRVPEMPEYGLGFWQSKLRYKTQDEVLDAGRKYHQLGIPVSVLIIDYFHWEYCGDWCFDRVRFPDPAAMVSELKRYGIKVMVSVWPQVDSKSKNFKYLKEHGYLVQSMLGNEVQMIHIGNQTFFDPTNPNARKYFWNELTNNYKKYGIDLFWLDEAEPEFEPYDFQRYRYFTGSVLQVGNLYPKEFVRSVADGEIGQGKSTSIKLVRCAWAGSQTYGALVWSGDVHSTWNALKNQIVSGQQMGMVGIAWWTTDIGGFLDGDVNDPRYHELLIRWFQFGTFCPVMRVHGFRRPHSKVLLPSGVETEPTGAPTEIWAYGNDNFKIMKKFIEIREKLRNYSRTVMEQAHIYGTPVMRSLFYEFPDDKGSWNNADEYLYGPDILVKPVTDPQVHDVRVYLPGNCDWINAHDGKRFHGSTTITVPTELSTLPVFLRDGALTELIGEI